ncbi:MAG: S8 family serine peptidase [Actinomycetes bacterium]
MSWSTPSPRRRTAALAAVASAALAAASIAAAPTAGAKPSDVPRGTPTSNGQALKAGKYIVMFDGIPAASYRGGVAGYAATRPAKGERMRPDRTAVVKYRAYLQKGHDRALDNVGVPTKKRLYDYTVAFNGVGAQLTAEQAQTLAKNPNVSGIFANERRELTTNVSPEFLGLTGAGGVWEQLGGVGRKGAGSGLVVGVVDTGIWPENPQVRFADSPKNRVPGWAGTCQSGEAFSQQDCTDKLIGARYFLDGIGRKNIAPYEFKSARDYDGHGTHTLTTAGGSPAEAVVDGVSYGTVSGMAPGAYVAAYKACWTDRGGDNGCYSIDTVAAIDAAVADGVDAINFAIGSSSETSVLDPDEIAFLFAADAGVFVAASAGNEGPGASTTDHVSPWLTSVAASTFKINEQAALLGNGERYVGASSTGTLPATPAVLAGEIGAAGADPGEAALCVPGTLDPAAAAGKVVVCDRGVIARVDKSKAVQQAGGAGMVLVNTSPNSLNADLHFVPSIHVDEVQGAAITQYVATAANPTIAIVPLKPGESRAVVPEIAEFSSRGPSTTTGGDILKPDIAAPGVDVLAGISPVTDAGRNWDLLSGTSMASPHIAGISLLIQQQHPSWSPAMVKSALQTTATDTVTTTSPFEQGSGLVQPRPGGNPGLVYNAGWNDWLAFIDGQGLDLDGVDPIDASDLNQATIAVGQLAGQQQVTRTVTNVGTAGTYQASVQGVPGVDVAVQPSTLSLAAGESASFTVTFTAEDSADLDAWSTGSITWTKGSTAVESAVAVKPVGVSAPGEVSGSGANGSVDVPVTSGFAGTLGTKVYGLVAGDTTEGSVTIDAGAFNDLAPQTGPAVTSYPITVAEGSTALRVDLDATNDASDLDLYLYNSAGDLVALSATGSGDEQITWPGVAAGEYTAYVHGWGGPSPAAYKLTSYVVGSTSEGNLSVSPSSVDVSVAEETTFTFAWSGLDNSRSYLGWVGYRKAGETVGLTLVSVN